MNGTQSSVVIYGDCWWQLRQYTAESTHCVDAEDRRAGDWVTALSPCPASNHFPCFGLVLSQHRAVVAAPKGPNVTENVFVRCRAARLVRCTSIGALPSRLVPVLDTISTQNHTAEVIVHNVVRTSEHRMLLPSKPDHRPQQLAPCHVKTQTHMCPPTLYGSVYHMGGPYFLQYWPWKTLAVVRR